MVFLFAGIPIGVSLGLVSLPFIIIAVGLDQSLYVIGQTIFHSWANYELLAIPLFTIMAEIFAASGIGTDLFAVAAVWTGGIRGGLAIATIMACAFFGAMCGSTLAAVALFAGLAMPEMLSRGYDKRLATGTVACAGGLAHLIPPSGMAIVYAWLTRQSPAKQMMAGLIPGLILAACFIIVVVVWTRINPGIAEITPPATWKQKFVATKRIFLPMIVVIVVLGSMFTGIATAVESAGLGCVAAFIIALILKRFSLKSLKTLITEVVRTCGFIFFIIAGVSIFAWVLSYHLIPQSLIKLVIDSGLSPMLFVFIMQLVYMVMGMFLNPNSIIFITVPIVVPIIQALGLDAMWYGVLLLINVEMAVVTPPVAMALYITHSRAPKGVALSDVIRGTVPFILGGDLVTLMLVFFFPQLALWIPKLMQ